MHANLLYSTELTGFFGLSTSLTTGRGEGFGGRKRLGALSQRKFVALIRSFIYAYSHIYRQQLMTPVQFFKCLSDETRLRCVTILQKEGKLCVCELTAALALSQPKISRHLAQLRQNGLLLDSREGQWVYYQISPKLPAWALPLLDEVLAAVAEGEQFQKDLERLNKMDCRPEVSVCC